MKITRNYGRYAVASIYPEEKRAKSKWGKKVLKNNGGLSYIWMNENVMPLKKYGLMANREYKTHKNGHGIEILKCRKCGKSFDNIQCRSGKRTVCYECGYK